MQRRGFILAVGITGVGLDTISISIAGVALLSSINNTIRIDTSYVKETARTAVGWAITLLTKINSAVSSTILCGWLIWAARIITARKLTLRRTTVEISICINVARIPIIARLAGLKNSVSACELIELNI